MAILRAPLPIGAVFTYVKLQERWRYAFNPLIYPRRARILYVARRRLSMLYTAIVRHGQVASWYAMALGSPLGAVARAISNAVKWIKQTTEKVVRAAPKPVQSVARALYSFSYKYASFWRSAADAVGGTARKVSRTLKSWMVKAGNAIHKAASGVVAGASSIARNVKAFCNKVKQGVTNTVAGAKKAWNNFVQSVSGGLQAVGRWFGTWGPFIGVLAMLGLLGYVLHSARGLM